MKRETNNPNGILYKNKIQNNYKNMFTSKIDEIESLINNENLEEKQKTLEIQKKNAYYKLEKFDPRDFSKKYKGIISQENILAAFNDIKKIIKEKEIKIEEGKKKIYLIFLQKNENERADVIFILRKKYICQNKINKIYIEKINSNLKILKSIEIKMNNLDKTLEDHNILFKKTKYITNKIIN